MEPPALPGWSPVPVPSRMGRSGAAPSAESPAPRLCPGLGPSQPSPVGKSGPALPAAFSLRWTLFSSWARCSSQKQPLGLASRALTGSNKCCLSNRWNPFPFSRHREELGPDMRTTSIPELLSSFPPTARPKGFRQPWRLSPPSPPGLLGEGLSPPPNDAVL